MDEHVGNCCFIFVHSIPHSYKKKREIQKTSGAIYAINSGPCPTYDLSGYQINTSFKWFDLGYSCCLHTN